MQLVDMSVYLHTNEIMNSRHFDIISFTVRVGSVYRQERAVIKVGPLDNAASLVLPQVRDYARRGHHVLVLENGSIKFDMCKLSAYALYVLETVDEVNYKKFCRGIDYLNGLTASQFHGHVKRTYSTV